MMKYPKYLLKFSYMYNVPPNSAVFYVFAVKIQGSHFPSSTYVLFIDCNFTLSTA